MSYYRAEIRNGATPWRLIRHDHGADLVLATSTTALGLALEPDLDYVPTLAISGGGPVEPATLSLSLWRHDNDQWLTPSGTWQAARVDCLIARDDPPGILFGAGYRAFRLLATAGTQVRVQEVTLAAQDHPTGPPIVANDYAAYREILARLRATGQFVEVRMTNTEAGKKPPAIWMPFAGVAPARMTTTSTYDDGTDIRVVSYLLFLVASDEDPEARIAHLSLMEVAARNALTGISYGGFCLYAKSELSLSVYPKGPHPDQRIEITAWFAYLIEKDDEASTTDLYVH